MDCADAGRKGGQSRSNKKRAASARNLELARRLRAEVKEVLAETTPETQSKTQWLADAAVVIEGLEQPEGPHPLLEEWTRNRHENAAERRSHSQAPVLIGVK